MKHYCLYCGNELDEEVLICPKCFKCSYLDTISNSSTALSSSLSAYQIECNTQWLKYKCGPNGSCGHGYAAEDANAIPDILIGRSVTLSGRDNSKSGPDRIVDGLSIQTKYCQTARQSVIAGFGEDGLYKYNGQVLEVPADQYDEAVVIMEKMITEGRVVGVSNPKEARNIIKKGTVTYPKAGNIDSLIFDAKTQSVVALSSFGISFAINFGLMMIFHCKNRDDLKQALEFSLEKGLKDGTITLTSSVFTTQFLRTSIGRDYAALWTKRSKDMVGKIYGTKIGQKMVHQLAKVMSGKSIYGGAARNIVDKVVKGTRTNAITAISFAIITTLPDAFRFFSRKISGAQFTKNIVVLLCGFGGMIVGGMAGSPGGLGGSIGGALVGSAGGQKAGKWVMDKIIKDDAEKLTPILQIALLNLSYEYMLQSEEELDHCIRAIISEDVIGPSLFYSLQQCPNDFARVSYAMNAFEYYFSVIIRERRSVKLMATQSMLLDLCYRINTRVFLYICILIITLVAFFVCVVVLLIV